MHLSNVYISAGCNQSPNCMSWKGHHLLYGSANAVVVVQKDEESLEAVQSYVAHKAKVNCVRWIDDEDYFLSCSTDKTVVIWKKQGDTAAQFRPLNILEGHEKSVTVASAIKLAGDDTSFLVASASGDLTLRIWKVADETSCQVISLKNSVALDVKVVVLEDSGLPLIFASLDDCKIHILGPHGGNNFVKLHRLVGHEGWIHSLDVCRVENGDLLLASCSQDTFVRVWRLSSRLEEEASQGRKAVADLDANEDISVKEEVFQVCDDESKAFLVVSLETVLAGHDDKVFSVQWRTRSGGTSVPNLLSSSMDKTMIVWSAPDERDQVWTEAVRVGEVGGNTLGFLGAQFSPGSKPGNFEIIGYSFSGAFHSWIQDGDHRWKPGVVMGGHFAPVKDLDWERGGRYLITTSSDQTTRVHAPWQNNRWHEIARPQVHGHDLQCLTALPDHRVASGAEEKIVRVFEATRMFVKNFSSITKLAIESHELNRAQGASVPSLGLSNKAVFGNEPSLPEDQRHVKDQYPDFYFKPEEYNRPPTEESLLQNTLWPEVQKLYGHGYELFCLSSNPNGSIVASACKASKSEHAQIILWDSAAWKIKQRLSGHALTVTQMEFSPCGKYLLSVSRDRTWCLFERTEEGDDKFIMVANTTDKKVHQRLIWSCSWSHDSKFFATCSRDKKVAVWTKSGLACKSPLLLDDSAMAVAFHQECHHDGNYVVAVGKENGSIDLIQWRSTAAVTDDEWTVLQTLDCNEAHHKAVNRLKFNKLDDRTFLASCSSDHSVKLFLLNQ